MADYAEIQRRIAEGLAPTGTPEEQQLQIQEKRRLDELKFQDQQQQEQKKFQDQQLQQQQQQNQKQS